MFQRYHETRTVAAGARMDALIYKRITSAQHVCRGSAGHTVLPRGPSSHIFYQVRRASHEAALVWQSGNFVELPTTGASVLHQAPRRSLSTCALSQTAEDPGRESQWMVIVALSAGCLFLCSMHRSFFSVLLPQISMQFGLTSTQVGVLQALTLFGYVIGQFPAGLMADRFGGAPVLLTGLLLWSIATCSTALAVLFPPLIAVGVSRVLLGITSSVIMPCTSAVTASWVPSDHKASALASILGSFNVGNAAGLAAAPVIAAILDWELAFAWAGVVGLVWAFMGWGVLIHSDAVGDQRVTNKHMVGNAAPSQKVSSSQVPWWQTPSGRQVLVLCVTHGVMGWGSFVLSGWMPMYLYSRGVTDPSMLGALACIPYLTASAVGLLVGAVADRMVRSGWKRWDVRRLMQSVMQLGLATFCLPLALHPSLSLQSVIACLTGAVCCYSFSYAGFHAYIQDVGAADAGQILGITNTCSILMGIVSTVSTGMIVDWVGGFQPAFLIVAGLFVISCLVWNTCLTGEPIQLSSACVPA